MNRNWSDNLCKRMEAHEEPSPEGLWEDIEQIIMKEHPIQSPSKQKKILLWGKRIGAAAAVVLVILFVRDNFLQESLWKPPLITQKEQVPYQPENNLPTHQHNERKHIAENCNNRNVSPDRNNVVVLTTSVSKESLDQKKVEPPIYKEEESEETKNVAYSEDSRNSSNMEKKTDDNQSATKGQNLDYNKYYGTDDNLSMIRQRNKPAKWVTSVYASNITSGSTNQYDGYARVTPLEQEDEEPIWEPLKVILVENENSEVYTDVKHRQPVTIGISVNYNMDNKWSLTSGLAYTRLSSHLRSGSDSYYYTSEQTLHNIGIPLNINYKVWKNKNMSIYVSGGGLVEKNLCGKLTTDYIINHKLESTKNDNISIDPLQWSLNTSVGVQYNLYAKIGLYMEPGISYYFKNGSEIETIYKEKPVNLNLRLGLRFSLGE